MKKNSLESVNEKIGAIVSWGLLLMALLTFVVVIFRYVFNLGWVWLQELVIYIHATVFLVCAGMALAKEGHVRVDILYSRLSLRGKAYVDLFGSLFLLLPVCFLIFIKSWPYVYDSWAVFEKSADAEGLSGVFLLKSLLLVFPTLLVLQSYCVMKRAWSKIRGGQIES